MVQLFTYYPLEFIKKKKKNSGSMVHLLEEKIEKPQTLANES